MTATLDIAWAAGFIEGDGCFSSINRNPSITALQVQREPLERLQRTFGGRRECKTCSTAYKKSYYVRRFKIKPSTFTEA